MFEFEIGAEFDFRVRRPRRRPGELSFKHSPPFNVRYSGLRGGGCQGAQPRNRLEGKSGKQISSGHSDIVIYFCL